MKLESRIKVAHGRCVPPEETIALLEALIAARYEYWIHEEAVSDHLHWAALFIEDHDFRAMGKGVSPAFSRAGALAEAAEWLAARDVTQLPGYVAAHQRDVEDALPIEHLVAHVATATPPVIERIQCLDDARHWVDGYSLIHERIVKVPIEYVRLIGGPNGRASGNCIEEAIVHATHEIFERRSQATVLRNRTVAPTIDSTTIRHPVLREQIEFIRARGVDVILKDLSFGGALPCVGACFVDPKVPDDFQFHHFFKVGASFDREEALIRALTEYTQGRKKEEFIGGSEAELARLLAPDFRGLRTQGGDCDNLLSSFMFGFIPFRQADFLRQGDLVPFDRGPCYRDCLDDIAHACDICAMLGKDYVVVDLTDPAIGFPVVQVIVPGYSDVLPFHPASSRGLFRRWTRSEVLQSYEV